MDKKTEAVLRFLAKILIKHGLDTVSWSDCNKLEHIEDGDFSDFEEE